VRSGNKGKVCRRRREERGGKVVSWRGRGLIRREKVFIAVANHVKRTGRKGGGKRGLSQVGELCNHCRFRYLHYIEHVSEFTTQNSS
jgi:hypothetical protein